MNLFKRLKIRHYINVYILVPTMGVALITAKKDEKKNKDVQLHDSIHFATSDTYLATYLMMCGANLKEITVKNRKVGKFLVPRWKYVFDEAPLTALGNWEARAGQVNVRAFAEAREKLKKLSKNRGYDQD